MQRQDPTPDDFALAGELPSEIGGILGQQMGMLKEYKDKFNLEKRKVDESILFLKNIKAQQAGVTMDYTRERTEKVKKETELLDKKETDKDKRDDAIGKEITDWESKRSDFITKSHKTLRGVLTRRKRGDMREEDIEWYDAYKSNLTAMEARVEELRTQRERLRSEETTEGNSWVGEDGNTYVIGEIYEFPNGRYKAIGKDQFKPVKE